MKYVVEHKIGVKLGIMRNGKERFSPIFSDFLQNSLIISIIFPNFAVFLHNILRYEKVKKRY